MRTLTELRAEQQMLGAAMTRLLDDAVTEGRDLTREESDQHDADIERYDALTRSIRRLEHRDSVLADLPPSNAADEFIIRGRGAGDDNLEVDDGIGTLDRANDRGARFLGPNERIRARGERGLRIEGERVGAGDYLRALFMGPSSDAEVRALAEGSDSAGGFTVPEILSEEIIDLMRAKMVTQRAGARTVMLDTEKTHFAKITADPVAAWRVENAAVNESEPVFGRITLQARSLALLVKASVEVVEDSVNIEAALMRTVTQGMAVAFDRIALFGSGTAPEPRGVANFPNIHTVDMGTNGGQLNGYGSILDARYELLNANAAEPTAAIMSPRSETAFAKMVDGNNQPLQRPPAIDRLPFLQTTSVPINDTHGTATDASRILVGDYRDLWIGIRHGLRIRKLSERFAENVQIGFIATLRADVQLAREESFCAIEGVIP